MKCSNCNKNEANIHLDGTVNGKTIQLHLCEECAKHKGIECNISKPHFSLVDLLANLSDWEIPGHKTMKTLSCPVCGLNYTKFKEIGRLGCSKCYEAFSLQLMPLLKRIHGSAKHVGKKMEQKTFVEDDQSGPLKQELLRAIKNEEFEKAAELRDKIKQLRKTQESTEPK